MNSLYHEHQDDGALWVCAPGGVLLASIDWYLDVQEYRATTNSRLALGYKAFNYITNLLYKLNGIKHEEQEEQQI